MMQTCRGAHIPVLKIDVSPVSLSIGNRLPASGLVYAGAAKIFSWTATNPYASNTFGTVVQASAKLRYRKLGGAITEISIAGATNNYTFPAATFDANSDYEWQVEVTSNDNVTTTSSWLQFGTYLPPLVIGNRLPSGGFVYAGADKQFSWTSTPSTSDPVVQASAKLRYRKTGAGTYTELDITGATDHYNMQAHTLDGASNYEWQLEVTSNDDIVTTSNWIQFSTTDATPDKPTLIGPKNEFVETDKDIEFSWDHVINTGTPQTKAELEYSYSGGLWMILATVIGPDETYTVPANTLPAGSLRWRARTYNTDNVAGEWSDPVTFSGVGSPLAPVITGITSSSRPAISWQSIGQTGYQLRIAQDGASIYDSGETAGTWKAHTLPLYLANGSYTLSLRIINASLLWSNWTEHTFTLAVTPPAAPEITAAKTENGAHIAIAGVDESIAHMYLLRNGIPVADITGLTEYDDYSALGETEYAVRAVDGNENYADSNTTGVNVTVPYAVLAAADDLSDMVMMNKKAAGQPAMTRQKQIIGTSHNYAGREFPLYVFSEFSDESYSPAYYYTTTEEWEKLEALIKRRRTVLYRDKLGNKYYGAITSINHTQEGDMIIFAMTMQRVDYVERISYAEAET